MAGIKETKELIIAAFAIAKVLKGELADGFQLDDVEGVFKGLLEDPEVRAKIIDGVAGSDLVLAEAKDVDVFEGIGLVRLVLDQVSKL